MTEQFISFPGARLCIYEDGGLYLTIANAFTTVNERSRLVRIVPVTPDGEETSYTCVRRRSELVIRSGSGVLRLHVTSGDILLVSGENLGADLHFKPSESMFECCCNTEEDTLEAMLYATGKLRFVSYAGLITHTAKWNAQIAQSADYHISLRPDDTGVLAAAVHQYASNWDQKKIVFDYQGTLERDWTAFLEFGKKHGFTTGFSADTDTGSCADMKADDSVTALLYDAWANLAVCGFRDPVYGFVSDKAASTAVTGWQQAVNAAMLSADPAMVVRLTGSYLSHITETGALPGAVGSIQDEYLWAAPPIFGWALGRTDLALVPVSDLKQVCGALYDNLEWWFTRGQENPPKPALNNALESGIFCEAMLFDPEPAMPVITPDLLTWLILQTETCMRMAEMLSAQEQPSVGRLTYIKDTLIKELSDLWDGRQFEAACLNTGEKKEMHTPLRFIPLLAGELLPEDITVRMLEDVRAWLEDNTNVWDCPEDEAFPADPAMLPFGAVLLDAFDRLDERFAEPVMACRDLLLAGMHNLSPADSCQALAKCFINSYAS